MEPPETPALASPWLPRAAQTTAWPGLSTMPIIQCEIREGRTPEQKRALAQATTRVVQETIDAPLE